MSSLGLQRGDQIFVNEATDSGIGSQGVRERPDSVVPLTQIPTTTPLSSPQNPSGADSVEVDGSFLVHRV